MSNTIQRYQRSRLQLANLEVTVWENCLPDQTGVDEYTFTIERLRPVPDHKAREYVLENVEAITQLARWAEAEILSFHEDIL